MKTIEIEEIKIEPEFREKYNKEDAAMFSLLKRKENVSLSRNAFFQMLNGGCQWAKSLYASLSNSNVMVEGINKDIIEGLGRIETRLERRKVGPENHEYTMNGAVNVIIGEFEERIKEIERLINNTDSEESKKNHKKELESLKERKKIVLELLNQS